MTSKNVCPHCGCDAGAHFLACPRVGGPISFAFDRLFNGSHKEKSVIHLIVLDTETGGLSPEKHCIIELAAKLVRIDPKDRRIDGYDQFHVRLLPDRPVDPAAAKINGYERELWQHEAHKPTHAFRQFIAWVEALGHNDMIWAGSNVLGFDLPFLRSDMARVGLQLPGKPKMARRTLNTESLCFPVFAEGTVDSCGVAALRTWAGCEGEQKHTAVADVDDTIEIIAEYFKRYVWRKIEKIETERLRQRLSDTEHVADGLECHAFSLEAELKHLRWQRDSLQKRGSKLAVRNQRLRMKEMALEEIHRENARLTERVVMLERVAEKLHDECGSEVLTEEECYVLEAIDNPPTKGKRE